MENSFEDTILKQADAIQKVQQAAYQEGYKKGHIDASIEMAKTKKSFEDFLQDKFFQTNNPTKDDFEDEFDSWRSQLDVQEVIDFAEEWGK